jgi:aminopeptidase-like protein
MKEKMNKMNKEFQIEEFIEEYYMLNRAPVCSDLTFFTEKIKEIIPESKLIKSKSGDECLSWVIPDAWNVKTATLENEKREKIIDFKNNPLHLIQYSNSFKGKINFNELKKHLFYSKKNPKDIPFIYRKQYEFNRDDSWGFALPYNIFKNLDTNQQYYVNIDVKFEKSEIPIIDFMIPGEKEETVFFAAHSCHPAQVNDGIANIAILIKLFEWIKNRRNNKFSYRLIIGPEYYAAAVFLAKAKKINKIQYGMFLDMMAHKGPIGYASSYSGNSLVDYIMDKCVKRKFKKFKKYSYRGLWGNDEMFYDGPDFKIPTIGLGRSDFKNYHLSSDNMNTIDKKSLNDSLDLLKDIILEFENSKIFKRKYKGPLYLNRFNVYIDPKKNRQGYTDLQRIQISIDGKKSIEQISYELKIDKKFIENFVKELVKKNLISQI